MSLKEENSVLMIAESEELDYEGDDFNSPVKKSTLVKETDLEEGEISDTNDQKNLTKHVCYFFQTGKCILGDKCPGRHVTDCLYKMIDPCEFRNTLIDGNLHKSDSNHFHRMIRLTPPFAPKYHNVNSVKLQPKNFFLDNYQQQEPILTDFDRALIEAKKLVKQSKKDKNKTSSTDTPASLTVESDDDSLSDKSTKKIHYNKPFSGKKLSRSSVTKNFNKPPKQKSFETEKDSHCANKWHDPWRRSPVHPIKSVSSPCKLKQKRLSPCSPQRRKPNCRYISEERDCKIGEKWNKSTFRRSHSKSSSTKSTHCSKKKSSKSIHKKNISPVRDMSVTILEPYKLKRHSPKDGKKRQNKDLHRSSSSSSRASIHRAIKENLKIIQQKKTSIKRNKSDINLTLSTCSRQPREIVEKWKRNVFCRSSSSSSRASSIIDSRSIKTSVKAMQKKKTSAVEHKQPNKSRRFSDKQLRGISISDEHNAETYRSSTSSSPSIYRCKEIRSKRKNKQFSNESKFSSSVLDKSSKSERVKKKLPSFEFTSNCHLKDIGQWTPKKVTPTTVKSCSDMSISPLTDSSLSDIFDPDKNTSKPITYRHKASRSRSFQSSKDSQIYGPVCPPKNKILAPTNMSESKLKVIRNNKFPIGNMQETLKVVTSSPDLDKESKIKSKKIKRQKINKLEADLFKFHPEQNPRNANRKVTSKQILSNNVKRRNFKEISLNDTQRNAPEEITLSDDQLVAGEENPPNDVTQQILTNDSQRDVAEQILLNNAQGEAKEQISPNDAQGKAKQQIHQNGAQDEMKDMFPSNDTDVKVQILRNDAQKYAKNQIPPKDAKKDATDQIPLDVQGDANEPISPNLVQKVTPDQIFRNNNPKKVLEQISPNDVQKETSNQIPPNDIRERFAEQILPIDLQMGSRMLYKQLSRKEQIMQQLEAIEAAIERRKNIYASQKFSKE